jgi:hypothetical protein
MLHKVWPLRMDPFKGLLIVLTAVVAMGLFGLFCTNVLGADLLPTTDTPASSALVRPVVLTFNGVRVPKVRTSWFDWHDSLTSEELRSLATIYDSYSSDVIPAGDIKRMGQMMRLLAAGAGSRDADLHTLFFFTVMQAPGPHPARAFMEKKLKFDYTDLKAGDKEYTDFIKKVETTAELYGIPHSRWYP